MSDTELWGGSSSQIDSINNVDHLTGIEDINHVDHLSSIESMTTHSNHSAAADVPLQFKALFQRSSPSNNTVTASKLSQILARTSVGRENAAQILQKAIKESHPGVDVTSQSGTTVNEHAFYQALREAVDLQPTDEANTGSSDHPLALSEPNQSSEDLSADVPAYDPTSPDSIKVSLMDRKEGSFLFRHAVYSVSGQYNDKAFRVVRRYRDFCWLLEQLVHKYTFRLLPLLPPKRLTMDGRYLTGDEGAFLERRRLGLQRFINILVKHPALHSDPTVTTFLFVSTQFEAAKKIAKSNDAEVSTTEVSPLFISQWDQSAEDKLWKSIRLSTDEILAQVTAACLSLERSISRRRAEALDNDAFSRNLYAISRSLTDAYPSNNSELPAIQSAVEAAGSFADDFCTASSDAAKSLISGPLEELKRYRELLLGVRELFVRIDVYGGNSIANLAQRIKSARTKLADKATKPDTRPEEIQKLQRSISEAQDEIRRQKERDWSIRLIVSGELTMMQHIQFQISKFLRSYSDTLNTEAASRSSLTSNLFDAVGNAPLHS